MIDKLECTCIEAYKTRKMRDPNCCACSCDHNDLVEQLAKANERVKELENSTFDVIAAQSIDEAYRIANANPKDNAVLEALSAVKEGAANRLNKFAIEKKCESVSELNTYFVNRANREGEMLPIYFPDWCNDFREQLRKEQEK